MSALLRLSILSLVWCALALAMAACDKSTSPADVAEPPRADAGTDHRVDVGVATILDGSGSAGDGNLAYAWIQVSGPTAVGIDAAASGRARVIFATAGEYVFRLTVIDSRGLSSSDEVRLSAVAGTPAEEPDGQDSVNTPPKADAGADLNAEAGELVILDGSRSSDPDDEGLTYTWTQLSGPRQLGVADADESRAFVLPALAGEYVFELTVRDSRGATSSDALRLVVVDPPGKGEPEPPDDRPAPPPCQSSVRRP